MRTALEGGADMLFLDAKRIFTLPPLFEIREYSEFGPFNLCATAHYLGKGTHEHLSAKAQRASIKQVGAFRVVLVLRGTAKGTDSKHSHKNETWNVLMQPCLRLILLQQPTRSQYVDSIDAGIAHGSRGMASSAGNYLSAT